MIVLVGTLWSSIRQIDAPYMFDCENAIALHAMQGNRPHLAAMVKSHGFSRGAAGTWGIFSSYDGDAHSKREFVSEVRTLVLYDEDRGMVMEPM